MSLKERLIELKNKLLKKEAQEPKEKIEYEKMHQEKLVNKNKQCDLLLQQLEELTTPISIDEDDKSTEITTETRDHFISIVREYQAHDSTRYTIYEEEVLDSTFSYYLDCDQEGVNLTFKSYDHPIAASYHEHYHNPIQMLYHFSKLDIAEKKVEKGSSKK